MVTGVLEVLQPHVDVFTDLAIQCGSHDTCQRCKGCLHLGDHLPRMVDPVQRDVDVMQSAHRDVVGRSIDLTVFSDLDDHRAAIALLAERQRIRIARIRVPRRMPGCVKVADKGMVKARVWNLLLAEGGMRHLPRLFPHHRTPFGAVKERDVDPVAVDGEVLKESVSVGRRAMRSPPHGESRREFVCLEVAAGEDVHVRRPRGGCVQRSRTVPVVVARSQQDRYVKLVEGVGDESHRVRCEPLALVQVAATKQSVYGFCAREVADVREHLPQCLASCAAQLGTRPFEVAVEVQVGEVQEAHRGLPFRPVVLLWLQGTNPEAWRARSEARPQPGCLERRPVVVPPMRDDAGGEGRSHV